MAAPQVSVLLPAKNAASTLPRALQSVLGQTFPHIEVVALDDGSSDGTLSVLEAFARRDGRVRVFKGPGRGLVAALNAGLRECRGDFVARMDADDEALPRRLEASVAALEADPSLAGVGTQVEIFREDRPVSPNMQLYAQWLNGLTSAQRLRRERFIESPLCHPSVTMRRTALVDVGGFEDGDFPEDYQLWLKLLDRGHELRAVPEVLLRWRDHDARLTRTDGRYGEARFWALKAEFLARGPLAGTRRCSVWGAGRTGLGLARLLRARGVEVTRLFEVDPAKVGQRIDGVPVCSWEEVGSPSGEHLVAAVGAKGAREEIRRALRERGWTEGVDFTCAA